MQKLKTTWTTIQRKPSDNKFGEETIMA